MKLALSLQLALGFGLATANLLDLDFLHPHHHHNNKLKVTQGPHDWVPAGPDDARSPCPMLNTLANHAYIHHDGRNITRGDLAEALMQTVNFDQALAMSMFDTVQKMNPGATDFDLYSSIHPSIHQGLGSVVLMST